MREGSSISGEQEAEADEEEGEDGKEEDGTVSLKREPTHQGMVGTKQYDFQWF